MPYRVSHIQEKHWIAQWLCDGERGGVTVQPVVLEIGPGDEKDSHFSKAQKYKYSSW